MGAVLSLPSLPAQAATTPLSLDPGRLLELLSLLRERVAAGHATGVFDAALARLFDPHHQLSSERVEHAAGWLRVEHAVGGLLDSGASASEAAEWANRRLRQGGSGGTLDHHQDPD